MVKIVAEIGCNHNGDVELAKQMMLKAHECGASAVKFQLFNSEKLVSVNAKKAEYQTKNTGTDESQIEMLKKLELSKEEYAEIYAFAREIGIEIFATAFEEESADFLHSIGQNVWKIPSGEITNLPLLEKIRDFKCPNKEIILSTGMSTLDEICVAATCLEQSADTKLTLLHCNTDYPTVDTDMNLLAMKKLQEEFPKWEIGLSDHSLGTLSAIMAVSLGATFIEKHFTLDKSMPGPDHVASITPDELTMLCEDVKRAALILGNQQKAVTDSERKNIFVARKSIVAKRDIKKGEVFSPENITCKRPGNGISPVHWYGVLGKVAESDFRCDELITCAGYPWEENMNNLAIIPARSGSKGLKDKNIKELNGVPLIAYSIRAALESGRFSRVMVSTDSPEYAKIAIEYGAEVPFLRSKNNASDRASSWDVVREVLGNYHEMGIDFDSVTLLQPTSPLRTSEDIRKAYDVYYGKKATSVVSVCEMEHSPLWSNTLPESLSLDGFMSTVNDRPRQELSTYYRLNGSIYIVDVDHIMAYGGVCEAGSYAYIMPNERSVDIDTELDFLLAKTVMDALSK